MDEDRFKYKYVFEVIDDGTAVLSVSEPDKATVTAKDDGENVIVSVKDDDTVSIEIFDINQGAPYSGEYDVIPKVEDQYLETTGRKLSKDMHVYKIPYYETSNESGGMTVSIAS